METAERSTPRSSPAPDPVSLPRVLGLRRGETPGTTLIVCAGVHGNEPAGVHACRRVLERLEHLSPKVQGEVVFLVGNRQALAAQRRYLERDLNRAWCDSGFRRLEEAPELRSRTEGLEQVELGAELEACIARARGPVVVLDLHSFSAEGPPFAILGDTLRNRRIALELHVPLILGLEETLDGTLLD